MSPQRPAPLGREALGEDVLVTLLAARDALGAWMDDQADPTADTVMRAGATFHALAGLVGYGPDGAR